MTALPLPGSKHRTPIGCRLTLPIVKKSNEFAGNDCRRFPLPTPLVSKAFVGWSRSEKFGSSRFSREIRPRKGRSRNRNQSSQTSRLSE